MTGERQRVSKKEIERKIEIEREIVKEIIRERKEK